MNTGKKSDLVSRRGLLKSMAVAARSTSKNSGARKARCRSAGRALAERVMGTKPSLDLKEYAGKYNSEMYGDAEIKFEGGKLTAEFGPYFNGDLERWNYDTFQVKWLDRVEGNGFPQFNLNARGKVDSVDRGAIGKLK